MLQVAAADPRAAIVCLSHLRWNFVFQRPQHLMTRFARERRVFYVEEPVYERGTPPRLQLERQGNLMIAVPHLPEDSTERSEELQAALLQELLSDEGVSEYILWYYTPMALGFTAELHPIATVYDCMDELSAFKGAPPRLKERESELIRRASVMLTGGESLFEAKRHLHPNIHPFPSSVDAAHFAQARHITETPPDQAAVPRPRLGFFGVIDERMDLALLEAIALARPEWHIVLLGPVVKIDLASLPRLPNIHYLGPKTYNDLPRYVAGWDVALLPFARNEATRFISPTKTPEYLAAGRPVVSTSIRDVVRPYAQHELVRIADDGASFVAACEAALHENSRTRMARADAFLQQMSWDRTWSRIQVLVDDAARRGVAAGPEPVAGAAKV